ncbi:hypothetical protein Tco_1461506 [Tanacetum coccineum]
MEEDGGTVDQHPKTVEETRTYFESLYNNLAIEVEKVNSVNRKLTETNADLTTELARYKNQEKCFEISQEKYDKLERCYQKSVYQEQCLTKKINALHLSSGKQITTLNEEISNLSKQLSTEKSTRLTSFETSDSLLEEFIDELALLDSFPPRNEDVDVESKLREIELLLNRDLSTNFSPTITIDPNPEKFTDEFAPACLPPPGDDESFLKEDVQEENFQVYSNPLFKFDDNYNSSNINPLFKEMLEDVESKDSSVSNFDKPVLLNTPLFDEDECFDP